MQTKNTVKSNLHCIIPNIDNFQCEIPHRTLDNWISGHIQVGMAKALVVSTILRIQAGDKLETLKLTLVL